MEWAVDESLTAATHTITYTITKQKLCMHMIVSGSCQTLNKIPLHSINQTHLVHMGWKGIVVVYNLKERGGHDHVFIFKFVFFGGGWDM